MSLPLVAVLDGLGAALAYPREGYRARVAECRDLLASGDSEAAAAVRAFCETTEHLNDAELEELYTRTFDLNPVCTPEVGWHIYGEQYRRGRFLVQARDLLKVVGIEERGELPDHLMSLLPAVARLKPDDAEGLRQVLGVDFRGRQGVIKLGCHTRFSLRYTVLGSSGWHVNSTTLGPCP